ncbi:hypothetical protein KR222_004604 [Zaprionus bogoriensis]|nr:hypothetical protein KR222_004604 [Zaprionus bogoriensis]
MPHKRFYLRLQLQLHALTCPGVWLCSHGYLEVTIKTLGYYFRTGAMEPRFPMLCHDQFTMEGYFRQVDSLEQMRQMLNAEQLEITLWQNGRRLAYYIGRLSDVMQAPVPRPSCEHSANVQLLMKATTAFPGILAPKAELSAELRAEDKQCGARCSKVDLQRPLSNRHVESRCLSRLELPRKQQAVCHARQSNCCASSPCRSRSYSPIAQQQRRLSCCSSSTQLSTQSQTSAGQDSCGTCCTSAISDALEHQRSCHICQAYSRLCGTRSS